LKKGNQAHAMVRKLLSPVTNVKKINYLNGGGAYRNLLCAHPPFQIDGNLGGAAAIAEMLIQSHNDVVEILPALPDVWKSGIFCGLKARGAIEVDADWKNGKLTGLKLKSPFQSKFKLKYGKLEKTIELHPNMVFEVNGRLEPRMTK
jgi:alpha-L-fucosidase 2